MAVVLDHLLRAPLPVLLAEAGVPDLEPAVARGVVAGRGVFHLLHVNGAGALVALGESAGLRAIGVLAELEGEG